MARHADEPTVRVHMLLYKRDWDKLCTMFGRHNNTSPSEAVRRMVRGFLAQVGAKADAVNEAMSKLDL